MKTLELTATFILGLIGITIGFLIAIGFKELVEILVGAM